MSEKKKVSELNPSASTNDDDLIMVVQENDNNELENFKQTRANFMANYYDKDNTYSRTEIDAKVASVYKYRGTVASYSNLPSTGLTVGDVYNVEDTGDNYAWTGTEWDKLGGTIDLTDYVKNTDYATSSKGGVVKISNDLGTNISPAGILLGFTRSLAGYNSMTAEGIISKGTLENVLNARIGDISTILQELDTGSGV